jgi:hypothetical protein
MSYVLTDEQFFLCKEDANKVAKFLMEKDVSLYFRDGGNINYVLETLVIICGGTLSLVSKQIGIEFPILLKSFMKEVESTVKNNPMNYKEH